MDEKITEADLLNMQGALEVLISRASTLMADNREQHVYDEAKHVAKLSKCFDYKHERRARCGELPEHD